MQTRSAATKIKAAKVETRIIEKLETHLHELFLNDIIVPVDYTTLAIHQRDDEELTRNRTDPKLSRNYSTETFGRKLLWTKKSDDDNRTRIWIPKSLQEPLIKWYHKNLMHPGARRLEDSVRCNFMCPGLSIITKEMTSNCNNCSENKLTNVVKDGQLPLKQEDLHKPFDLLSVDLCGPWQIKCTFAKTRATKNKKSYTRKTTVVQIWALTMIDEASSWPEIAPIKNKKASEIARLVDSNWFCRYPRPLYCIHDNGGEFIGKEFEEMLESYGIASKPTTVKNPQSNGLHERMHLVLCEMIRTQELHVPEFSTTDREIDMILQSAAWAMRTSTNLITKYSPGQLVFGRDMVIDKSVLADWDLIYAKRRTQQIRDNLRENKSRTKYEYKVGDLVRIVTKAHERQGKLIGYQHPGPFKVKLVQKEAGTVTIQCGNFDQKINIRRIKRVAN